METDSCRIVDEALSEVETLDSLRSLELCKYEAQAYLALLRDGPMYYKDLIDASDVPFGKLYDTTRNLARKGWIRILENQKPKIFVPLDPQRPLKRKLKRINDTVENLEKKFHEITPQLLDLYNKNGKKE